MNEESGELKQLFVYENGASRLELFIRIVYSIAIGIVLIVYGFIAEICMLIQWFVILILGLRNEELSNFINGYFEYMVHIVVYLLYDRRTTGNTAKVN